MGRIKTIRERFRRGLGAFAVDNGFRLVAHGGRLFPRARRELGKIETLRNIPYRQTGKQWHYLDAYLPPDAKPPFPVVLYVHGGGFRILSKDTHWLFALLFARRGYLVFNVNYRLAPRHPFPAAVQDVSAAYEWVVKNAHLYGGDVSRLVLAGESAGANLVTGLSISSCYRRPEPFAARVYESGVVPRATIAMCGMLQISDPALLRAAANRFERDRIEEVSDAYLQGAYDGPGGAELADPLVILEQGHAPDRPLPAFAASVGTRDPVQSHTRRLEKALANLGVVHHVRYDEGEPHAYQAMVFKQNVRDAWAEKFDFLDGRLALPSRRLELPAAS